jgi:hypothetical protein
MCPNSEYRRMSGDKKAGPLAEAGATVHPRNQKLSVFVTNHSCTGLMRMPAQVSPSG